MATNKGTKGPKKSRISTRRTSVARGDIISVLASGGGAAAGIASGTPLGVGVGVLAGTRSVRDLGAWMRGVFSQRQDRRVERLLEEAYFANAPDRTVGVELAAILASPRAQAVLMESIRAALESISEVVIPALAVLMREYQRTGTDPDAFFRGLCRVLQELTEEEYAAFGRMLHEIVLALRSGAGRQEEILFAVNRADSTYGIAVEAGVTLHPPGITFRSRHVRRFVRLLGANELGRAADVGLTREPVKWVIDWAVLTRLEQILSAAIEP